MLTTRNGSLTCRTIPRLGVLTEPLITCSSPEPFVLANTMFASRTRKGYRITCLLSASFSCRQEISESRIMIATR